MDLGDQLLIQFVNSLENMSKEELIEQVASRQLQNQLLKKQLKFTDSFVYQTPKEVQKPPQSQSFKTGLDNIGKVLNQKIVHAQKPGETIPKHDVAHFPKVQPYQNSAQKQPIQIIKQPFQIKNFGKIRLGANHYCPKKHHLHFQKQGGQFNCSKCFKKCRKHSWSCLSYNYNECISCTTYPKYHCPYNDLLRSSGTLNIDLSKRMCDICQDQIQANSLTCPSCNYDLCYKCAKS